LSVEKGPTTELQYVQETTYGQTPASPAGKWPGIVDEIPTIICNPTLLEVPAIKYATPFKVVATRFENGLRVKFQMQTQTSPYEQWLKGLIDGNSYSVEIKWGTLGKYFLLTGAKAEEITVRCALGEPVEVTVDLWGRQWAQTNSSSFASYQAVNTNAPWNWGDAGLYIADIGIAGVPEAEVRVGFGLKRLYTLGKDAGGFKFLIRKLERTVARLSGTFTRDFENVDEFVDLNSYTDPSYEYVERKIELLLNNVSGTKLVCEGCKYEKVDFPVDAEDLIAKKVGWRGKTLSYINL